MLVSIKAADRPSQLVSTLMSQYLHRVAIDEMTVSLDTSVKSRGSLTLGPRSLDQMIGMVLIVGSCCLWGEDFTVAELTSVQILLEFL